MKHVRYQSAGSVGLEETIDDLWEIAEDGYVVRSLHVQRDGSILKYDEGHASDRYGVLPEGKITDAMLADRSLGVATAISAADFDTRWAAKAKNERA